jgi:molybdopterin converting factor small subunit
VDEEYEFKARLETAVKAGDRLTLMPMISGG